MKSGARSTGVPTCPIRLSKALDHTGNSPNSRTRPSNPRTSYPQQQPYPQHQGQQPYGGYPGGPPPQGMPPQGLPPQNMPVGKKAFLAIHNIVVIVVALGALAGLKFGWDKIFESDAKGASVGDCLENKGSDLSPDMA